VEKRNEHDAAWSLTLQRKKGKKTSMVTHPAKKEKEQAWGFPCTIEKKSKQGSLPAKKHDTGKISNDDWRHDDRQRRPTTEG
jgi:hypothetical protein